MGTKAKLQPVEARPGIPLYRAVQEAMVDAIRAGIFEPGSRIPSTKVLSEQLSVSLVTAHRALQEMVAAGYLERTQGRGTFVMEGANTTGRRIKLGIVLNPDTSMADYYHGQILDGMCQACRANDLDLLMMHPNERSSQNCQGYMCVNPWPADLQTIARKYKNHAPVFTVGERSGVKGVPRIDVDNLDIPRQAVEHLHQLGHRRIGYVGSSSERSHSKDRHDGFLATCERLGIPAAESHLVAVEGWRMTDPEKAALQEALSRDDGPTAIFAGGYYLALDVYAAAARMGIQIPTDLSVVGVDDPPSAAHLSPPMTTLRQPLIKLGHTAVIVMEQAIQTGKVPDADQILKPELIARSSSAPPK